MTISPQSERRFVQGALPWAIAAAGLLIYLATLNHWLTLGNLTVAADVTRWHWQPMLSRPVLFLLTLPVRWLPGAWVPLALNLFTAVCASLTLALLARSVALLPHDRLEQQRLLVRDDHGLLTLRSAWVPPVFAAVALGLQLTFWENATALSGEMLELLLFAAMIWCLLEYRCDPQLRWLDRASLVCGIALANSWAMACFVPLVAVALVWSKRLRFFNVRFLQHIESSAWRKALPALGADVRFFLRMFLFGLAGLSLVLVLPLVQLFAPDSTLTFWEALKGSFISYKSTLWLLTRRVFLGHREVSLLLVAVSLAPLFLLSIRWRALTGRESPDRLDLVSVTLYAAHAFLLVLCVAVAFDPPFSPRQLGRRLGLAFPFLPLYYLGALSIGYYSGFLLLIFSGYLGRRRIVLRALRWTAPKFVYVLLALTLTGLLLKNVPTISVTNGPQLEQYARLMVDSLPPEGAVVCSSDSSRLALLQAALARERKAGLYVPVDANALPFERYRAVLGQNHPRQWTEPPASDDLAASASTTLDPGGFVRLLAWLAQSNRVCYLQSSHSPLGEHFHLQPRGLVYELKAYPTNSFSGPPLTATNLAQNERLWQRVIETATDPLAELISEAAKPPRDFAGRLLARAHVSRPLPESLKVLAQWYSSAFNSWGVTLQCNDRWEAATSFFAKAGELNPDNLPARLNLECNTNRLAGRELTLATATSIEEQINRSRYRTLNQILNADGPFDEPSYCYQLGMALVQQNLTRQAGHQLERVRVLAPSAVYPRLVLVKLLNFCRLPDRALQIAAEITANPNLQALDPKEKAEVAFLEAEAWLTKTNQAKALGILQSLLDSQPGDTALLNRTKVAFAQLGSFTNALRIADQQLQVAPDNLQALLDRGVLGLQAGEFSNAIPVFTRLLSLTNAYVGWFYRAQAYQRAGQLDAAEADYREALRTSPAAFEPYLRLAEIAALRGDTNTAQQHYQHGVSNALRLADRELEARPDNPQALADKGILYMRAGQFSNAIPVFTRLMSLTNTYVGRMYRAQAYMQDRQWEAAAADYQEALRAAPAAPEPHYALAQVAFRSGDTNAAQQHYQHAVSNALRIADQQLRRNPDNLQALVNKARLCVEARQFSNAIPPLTRILSLTNNFDVRTYRALVYLQTSQWDAALADYQEMLRLVPTAYQPYYGLAEVARGKGDTNAALRYYQQYLSNAPTNQGEFRTVSERLRSLQRAEGGGSHNP